MIPREILKKIRQIEIPLLLLSAAIATGGCGGTKASPPVVLKGNIICDKHAFQGVVLLAPENVWPPTTHGDFSSLWSPSPEVVNDAIAKIADYLRNVHAENSYQAEDLREMRARLPKTVCQAVGITYEGKKAILLNCLSGDGFVAKYWLEHFVKVWDGGAHYWNIVYIPEDGSFVNLEINGLA